MLTAERLRELLDYDPETGVFRWKIIRAKATKGAEAGCLNGSGYRVIGVDGTLYSAHRLAWLAVYGEWPTKNIDHANGDKSDNRVTNLRQADQSLNRANSLRHRTKRAGLKGAYKRHKRDSWNSRLTFKGVLYDLGTFPTAEEAHLAYCEAAELLFGDFANFGYLPGDAKQSAASRRRTSQRAA